MYHTTALNIINSAPLWDTHLTLLYYGAVASATYMLVKGNIFKWLRSWLDWFFGKKTHPLHCSLCTGMWVGLIFAATINVCLGFVNKEAITYMLMVMYSLSAALISFTTDLVLTHCEQQVNNKSGKRGHRTYPKV